MKIAYAYGKMFIIHPSGHVDAYDKDSIESLRITQRNDIDIANAEIKVFDNHLIEMSKTVSDTVPETGKKGIVARTFRRLKNALG